MTSPPVFTLYTRRRHEGMLQSDMDVVLNQHPIRHLYVHIPFCSGKCSYCVLYSVMYDEQRASRYVEALSGEMDQWRRTGPPLKPETIFIGGGTPSSLAEDSFARLLQHVRSRIDPSALVEWTIEAQPGTLTPRKVAAMLAAGVNRISFGVQALTDATLQRIFRRHSVADVETSLACAREGGIDNVGIDLIACLPGVTSDEWRASVAQAARLPVQHLSVYALTIEDGSLLADQVERGEFTPADDDTQVAELDVAESILGEAGFHRYEFSNYARPGRECLHNLAYWRGNDYLGFGPAASSRVGTERWTNVADVNAYVAAAEAGNPVRRERDTLDARADLTERLMFGFRLAEGVNLDRFADADADLITHWKSALARLSDQGVVTQQGARWTLTPTGRLLADHVAEELIPAHRD
ncbi:MAG: radical SAM family heme chaperone HemW [Lentisphaerae bacterium]|nr:radical SAM family heme chaperone HemW [Lentisphaerota bacterium]